MDDLAQNMTMLIVVLIILEASYPCAKALKLTEWAETNDEATCPVLKDKKMTGVCSKKQMISCLFFL